jgi:hypothetical protein
MGNIAMLPDVRVPSQLGLMEAYLIEARSIKGVSGSPVFARRTACLLFNDGRPGDSARTLHGMTGETHLIGVMHGHWDVKELEINQARIEPLGIDRREQGVNLGIALVIPATKLIETLNRDDLMHMREEQEDIFLEQQRPGTCD